MTRPTGVTIIAVLHFLVTGSTLLFAVLMFLGGGFLATLINQQSGGSVGAGMMAGLGAVVGVLFLIGAGVSALLGWGLWNLKNWARILDVVLSVLGILGALTMLLHFNPLIFFIFIIRLAISGLILWYLLRPDVVATFQN